MQNPKTLQLIFLFFIGFSFYQCNSQTTLNFTHSIPFIGNTWAENTENRIIGRRGVSNWTQETTILNSYFKTSKTGKIHIALIAKVDRGESKIAVTLNNQTKQVDLRHTHYDTINIGHFPVPGKGYQKLSFQGLKKDGHQFADIQKILVAGEATAGNFYYVKDEYYWGRRGPSVHLTYYPPEEATEVVWFYNEINVPAGEDVIGSYFMANGFGEGYFGIQVNSPSERRILFSVWSPFRTDNPNEIPEDQRITLLKKGENVHAGKFGNEGSGGQSYRQYMWKAGTTYRFLLKGKPSVDNSTDYTAYFFAPEIGKWELIASFRRPQTSTYLTRHHSFLENFIPEMGNVSRKGFYQNQWICDKKGDWYEMTRAGFTADNTARKQARMDYAGGVEGNKFFMKNCGFFNETTAIGSVFTRKATNRKPDIDFSQLP